MNKKQILMLAAGATLLGLLLPWVTFADGIAQAMKALGQSASVSGLETGDGKIVLVLGLVGAAVAAAVFLGKSLPIAGKKAMLIGGICMALAALISVIDFLDISAPAQVGIGLWLSLAGSIVGTATSFLLWKQMGGQVRGGGA